MIWACRRPSSVVAAAASCCQDVRARSTCPCASSSVAMRRLLSRNLEHRGVRLLVVRDGLVVGPCIDVLVGARIKSPDERP